MSNDQVQSLREQLLHALRGDQSHVDFETAITDFPVAKAGVKPHGAPHSAWQLLEHLRIAQHDILEFSRNPKHKSPKWPDEYWPKSDAPSDSESWEASVAAFERDEKEFEEFIGGHDLFAMIDGGQGQTLLREALVAAAHHSYHLGQLVYLKKMLQS